MMQNQKSISPERDLWRSLEAYKYEQIYSRVFDTAASGSKYVAHEIAGLMRQADGTGKPFVLGLATGNSPIKVYEELVRLHLEEGLSFRNVISFNLDEYYGLGKADVQSYIHFMHHHLFNHVDILPQNIHIPSGQVPFDELAQYCLDYEAQIAGFGGLDFQLLGIGRTGHIGFNEPGSKQDSTTRIITLDYMTRQDNAFAFNDISEVPKKAVTMGVGTILQARRIVLLAWGASKADIIAKTIEGEISPEIPATFLQTHKQVTFVMDEAATAGLTRVKTPWLVGDCEWTTDMIRKAVVWLSLKLGKPVLKLTDRDYNDHGMSGITGEKGAYYTNIEVFSHFQRTITGWPGGKPNADDTNRPERAFPARKRVLIFSPHPDDDVISMGGTFLRLVEQGHEVHVAYQTSGNTAVADHETLRFVEFARDLSHRLGSPVSGFDQLISQLAAKKSNDFTPESIRMTRALIRRGEALSACRYFGLPDDRVHFLDLPFYETGKREKSAPGPADFQIVTDVIKEIKPHQIFAAGDLADPHGTHEVCLKIILEVLDQLKGHDFIADCRLWLYRGAWHEYSLNEIDMAVPLSPDELYKKRMAIWRHQSQKDGVVYQGEDEREFWQRAEDRNRAIAQKYDQLGLAEYEALETFKRHHF